VVDLGLGTNTLSLGAGRRVQDVSDFLVTAPVVNSITSQEVGQDYGDYALVDWVRARIRRPVADRTALSLAVALETSHDMAVTATPARGSYRANPALGAGQFTTATLTLTREAAGMAARHGLSGEVSLEGGSGPTDYLRASAALRWQAPLGPGAIRVLAYGWVRRRRPAGVPQLRHGEGVAPVYPSASSAGAWRWGTRNGVQPARSRRSLGTFCQHRADFILAPFVGTGWSERAVPGTPWVASDGLRSTAGLATEWFMGLIRLEGGVGLSDGLFEVTLDVTREWWNIL
jgi:hypothetical protein